MPSEPAASGPGSPCPGSPGPATLRPTPRPAEGVVSWNLTTACNYRCGYCTQRLKADRGRWSRDIEAFLAAFARLPGPWEVKLSGGEPFVHPELERVAAGLASIGHRVSVVTNFSAPRDKLAAFVTAAAGRVGVFSCSLHLPYVEGEVALAGYFAKARWLAELLARSAPPDGEAPGGRPAAPRLCVTTVATRRALPLLPALAERAGEAGIPFKVQPEKQDREVISYTAEEERLILSLGGHNLTGRIVHRLEGRPCWAGSRYFILDDEGLAFRCYPARRHRVERLGSFLSPGFRLAEDPSPCLYGTCNCTVPIARGMMPLDEGERAAFQDEEVPS